MDQDSSSELKLIPIKGAAGVLPEWCGWKVASRDNSSGEYRVWDYSTALAWARFAALNSDIIARAPLELRQEFERCRVVATMREMG